MKLCLTLLTALLFCASASVSFAAEDKAAKGDAEKSARDAGKAADKAAGKDKAKKDATAGDAATPEKPKAMRPDRFRLTLQAARCGLLPTARSARRPDRRASQR